MTSYRTVEVDGNEIFYREAGPPSAQTVLLLHGFPSSSTQYETLMGHLAGSFHSVAPDYPGFGQSRPLAGATTFDALARVIDEFTRAVGLTRFSMYMFDFGSPVGFRLASADPGRIEALILQNANAYEAGLGPNMRALEPYWADRAGNEDAIRRFLTREVTRSQYVDGVRDLSAVNPDLWELDQRYLECAGRDVVMLDLLHDYKSNVALYPTWQKYMREHRPRALLPWGRNDPFFPVAGAEAYLEDLPDAQIKLLDTGHFATATHSAQIAALMASFLHDACDPAATMELAN